MQLSVGLPTNQVEHGEEFLGATAVADAARAAEQAGFDACYVTDHPFPLDRWLREGGHHALDPFVALSFAAAATSRIKLQTHILVLPYRNPFLAAKSAASLDVLSGGRLILGVAAGYLRGEFAALGADFEARNEVSDEAIRAMRAAWSEDELHLEGRHFHAVGNTMRPRPARPGGPPIWVGGNSKRAIRRAVELGDGWVPFPNPASAAPHTRSDAIESVPDLAERIGYARQHARDVARAAPLDICYSLGSFAEGDPFDAAALGDAARALSELGVTWATVRLTALSRTGFIREVERLGTALRR